MRADQELGRILHRHDADMSARELAQQVAVFLEADLEAGHLQDDGLAGKEIGRAGQPAVERLEPFGERRLGLEREGEERAGAELN